VPGRFRAVQLRRAGTAFLLVALIAGIGAEDAGAHAGPVSLDPAPGATLGASPTAIRVTFSEQPETSLSEVHVRDADGVAQENGSLQQAPGDPLTLTVAAPRLGRGVYTVSYRVVSAVDGHATSGSYQFGVRASPEGGTTSVSTEPDTSVGELVARWILLIGLVGLLGASVAGAAGFGGPTGPNLRLAAGAAGVSLLGVALLAVAQSRTADSTLGELLDTPVGEALIWRAVAIAVAGGAIGLARRRPDVTRGALAVASLAALAAIVVHVDAGHAAAGTWPSAVSVGLQSAHFAAAGIWFGGLAALLVGIRGAGPEAKTAAIRRFGAVAAGALIVVLATGTVRAVDELSSWGDLIDTGYGRTVLAKVEIFVLIAAIVVIGLRRGLPGPGGDLRPLLRRSKTELALALVALASAAVLGTLAPPVTGEPSPAPGLSDFGSDPIETVEAELSVPSDEPGPNSFQVRLEEADSGDPLEADRVSLRFTPLDDPGVAPTSLALKPGAAEGSYAGTGANLAFDGRWGVTVVVEGDAGEVEVPLELDLPIPEAHISPLRLPGMPPKYTVQVGSYGSFVISPHPEAAGPSRVFITTFDVFSNFVPTRYLVLTAAAGDDPPEQQPVRRLSGWAFVADVELEPGENTLTAVATTRGGIRLRGAVDLDVPEG
jgi:copper transport protein